MHTKESTKITEEPLSVHTTSNMKNNIPEFIYLLYILHVKN